MQANEKSASKTDEGQGKTGGSRSKLPPEKQPEVIEKKETSIQFQENEPEAQKKTSPQTAGNEEEEPEGQEKKPSQTAADEEEDDSEVNKEGGKPWFAWLTGEKEESEDQEKEPSQTPVSDEDNKPVVQEITSSQSAENEDDVFEAQENEPSQTAIDENEDNSEKQDGDESEDDHEPSQTAADEEEDDSEDKKDGGKPWFAWLTGKKEESEDQEKEPSDNDDLEEQEEPQEQKEPEEQEKPDGQEEQAVQDTAGSSKTSQPDSIGNEAIENASKESSIIASGSSKKLLPHLSSSEVVIDKATLSYSIESLEKVSKRQDDKGEDEIEGKDEDETEDKDGAGSKKGPRRRKALLPSISSAGVVVDEQSITGKSESEESEYDESEDDEFKADYAFSMFSNVLQEEELRRSTEENLEPLVHQNKLFTIEATEEDIKGHFSKEPVKKPSTRLQRKSSSKLLTPKPSTRLSTMRPQELKTEVPKTDSSSKPTVSGQSPSPNELCSEWVPSKYEPRVGYHYRLQSWVGDYILGCDYWTKKENEPEKEIKEVRFNIDDGHRWYDTSMSDTKISKAAIDEKRDVSMKKIEALKVKAPTDVNRGEKRLPIAYDPKQPVDENLKYDLQDMFMEFARSDTSTAKNRMSLKNADKWLEKVNLLDHKNLTLIHTGLCFRAAGGSRYRGLTFDEFFTFIEMISDTRNMPLEHAINRLKFAVLDITLSERMR